MLNLILDRHRWYWVGAASTATDYNILNTSAKGRSHDVHTYFSESYLFVVNYDSSGTKQWTRPRGTLNYDYGNGVSTYSSGNV